MNDIRIPIGPLTSVHAASSAERILVLLDAKQQVLWRDVPDDRKRQLRREALLEAKHLLGEEDYLLETWCYNPYNWRMFFMRHEELVELLDLGKKAVLILRTSRALS